MLPVGAAQNVLGTSRGAATAPAAAYSRAWTGYSVHLSSSRHQLQPQHHHQPSGAAWQHAVRYRQYRQQRHRPQASNGNDTNDSSSPLRIEAPELLLGDCAALLCSALLKQIAGIALSPAFPGWLAPLGLSPQGFAEFASFTAVLLVSWVAGAALTGGYSASAAAAADTTTSLRVAGRAWLVALPLAAAGLLLAAAAAAEPGQGDLLLLVGQGPSQGLDGALQAASGLRQQLGPAAGLLGLMCCWRVAYAAYNASWDQAAWMVEARRLQVVLAAAAGLAAVGGLLLQLLQLAQPGEG